MGIKKFFIFISLILINILISVPLFSQDSCTKAAFQPWHQMKIEGEDEAIQNSSSVIGSPEELTQAQRDMDENFLKLVKNKYNFDKYIEPETHIKGTLLGQAQCLSFDLTLNINENIKPKWTLFNKEGKEVSISQPPSSLPFASLDQIITEM
ncbi:MAG: hypothetical protein HYY62_07005, partial [Deltaproteobacteria bacterium]|nr:hypothetical protein [Deltaproteobacteria bacterium]